MRPSERTLAHWPRARDERPFGRLLDYVRACHLRPSGKESAQDGRVGARNASEEEEEKEKGAKVGGGRPIWWRLLNH